MLLLLQRRADEKERKKTLCQLEERKLLIYTPPTPSVGTLNSAGVIACAAGDACVE